MFKFSLVVSLFVGLFATHSVQANVSWSFDSNNCVPNCSNINSNNYGNTQDFGSSSDNVSVNAFSTSIIQQGSNAFDTANLRLYQGGLGIYNRGSGDQHTIDNYGYTDAVQFSFNENTSLNGVEIGWKDNDSDITVLAHDGIGDKSLLGKTFAELLTNGWNFIGHYSNLVVNQTKTINTGDYFSSDWLITAYSPEAGSPKNWTFGNDYFKLSKLTGKVSQPGSGSVPEPSSILLLLLATIGWKISNNSLNRLDSSLKIV